MSTNLFITLKQLKKDKYKFIIKNNMICTPEEYQKKYKKFVQILNFSWNFWPQPRFSRASLYLFNIYASELK